MSRDSYADYWDANCPNRDLHYPDRSSYHRWAEEMQRTHRQIRCPGCDRFVIWRPREDGPKLPPVEYRLDHESCGCCDGDDHYCDCEFHPEHPGTVRPLRRFATWLRRRSAAPGAVTE